MGLPERKTLTIEFKSDRKTIAESVIVDEVVALSNTDRGELYIGVEDDGVPTGAQPQYREPLQMNAMIANKTVPSVSVRTTILMESEKTCCSYRGSALDKRYRFGAGTYLAPPS